MNNPERVLREITDMCFKAVIIALGIALLAIMLAGLAHCQTMPEFAGVKTYSCSAVEAIDFAGVGWWHITVSLEYTDGKHHQKLYSMRPAQDGRKAVMDCAKWMQDTKKAIIKAEKESKRDAETGSHSQRPEPADDTPRPAPKPGSDALHAQKEP